MESERPIEKLLRVCAEKRRHEAKLPTELHPATRRLLQGEVARQLGEKQRERRGAWWSSLVAWPKLAWATAGASALLVIALVLLLPGKSHKPDLLAKNDQPVPAANSPLAPSRALDRADADVLAKPPVVQKQLLPAESEASAALTAEAGRMRELAKDKVAVAVKAQRETSLAAVPQPTTVTASPAGATAGSAGRNAEPMAFGVGGMKAEAPTAAARPAPAAAPAQPPPALYGDLRVQTSLPAPQAPLSAATEYSFRDQARFPGGKLQEQVSLRTAARPVSAGVQPSAAQNSVLTSFRVQPAKDGVVIVDGDGSVYRGYLQAAPTEPQTAPVTRGTRLANRRFGSDAVTGDTKRSAPSYTAPYFFHVLGTNKTLNQKVEFTGNVWPQTNLPSPKLTGAAASLPTSRTTTNVLPAWLLNSRISGKAIINSQQVIEVNAAPAKP